MSKKCLIVGSGIAGTSLALCMQKAKIPLLPVICEAAKEVKPIGTTITLAPNGLSVMKQIGLLDKVIESATLLQNQTLFDSESNRVIGTNSFDFTTRKFGYPMAMLERSTLQNILMSSLPSGTVQLSKRLVHVENQPNKIIASFEDGTSEECDVLIGADGLNSRVRGFMPSEQNNSESSVKYTGYTLALGLTSPLPDFPVAGGDMSWVIGDGLICGTWGLKDRKQWWFIASREAEPSAKCADWTTVNINGNAGDQRSAGGLGSMVQRFLEQNHPYDARRLIEATLPDRAIKLSIYSRRTGRLAEGRIGLIGDAAHVMSSAIGQGGNMALEDALALSNSFATAHQKFGSLNDTSIPQALEFYAKQRAKRSQDAVTMSLQATDIQTADVWHKKVLRSFLFGKAPKWLLENSMSYFYKHQPKLVEL